MKALLADAFRYCFIFITKWLCATDARYYADCFIRQFLIGHMVKLVVKLGGSPNTD